MTSLARLSQGGFVFSTVDRIYTDRSTSQLLNFQIYDDIIKTAKEGKYMNIGIVISEKRKVLGLTQQALAENLHVSFQAISKWENGTSCPDIELLPQIAAVLKTTIDSLLGYPTQSVTDYDKRYGNEGY